MRLSDAIRERPSSDTLWVSGTGQLRAGSLQGYLERLDGSIDRYRGRSVALQSSDARTLAVGLVALDGVAESLFLLPVDDTEAAAFERARALGCAALIRDGVDVNGEEPRPLFDWQLALTAPVTRARPRTQQADTRWVIPTSGTSGAPKFVSLRLAELTRSVKLDFRVGVRLRWGLLYDLNRFAGLQVFFQALYGGSRLILPTPFLDTGGVVREFLATGCNAISATPSTWRRLLMIEGVERLMVSLASLGGEIADQRLLSTIARMFPDVRLTHIYASTELGVGFSVRDGLAGFPADFLDTPPAGTPLRIGSDGHLLFAADAQQLALGGSLAEGSAWLDTGDLVEQRGNRVYFLGRANGAINVGGRKVMPQEVEDVIRKNEGVASVQVSARRSSVLGNVVEARVVPRAGVNPVELRAAIDEACSKQLESFKRPVVLHFVDELKLTAAGKIPRG